MEADNVTAVNVFINTAVAACPSCMLPFLWITTFLKVMAPKLPFTYSTPHTTILTNKNIGIVHHWRCSDLTHDALQSNGHTRVLVPNLQVKDSNDLFPTIHYQEYML